MLSRAGGLITAWQIAATIVLFCLTKLILEAIYRVTLHPLTRFPGPILAALSYKYEFFFDGIKGGQYTNEIARLHRIYGPIVRINPDELHCNDPNFIDQIYAGAGKRRHKSSYWLDGLGPGLSAFSTVPHEIHRIRRAALNRYFSKASITKLEPPIHNLVDRLCNKLLARRGNGKPFDITMAYSCLTTDVISYYAFGQSEGFLEQEDFTPNLRPTVHAALRPAPYVRQWPFLFYLIASVPDALAKRLSQDVKTFIDYIDGLKRRIKELKKAYHQDHITDNKGHSNVFIELLNSNLPEKEKSEERLGNEAVAIIAAGTETTAWSLSVLTFYLLTMPEVRSKIEAELMTVIDDLGNLPKWSKLEQLPYLSAVLLETIRLSYGVATRLPRIAPDETLIYEGEFQDNPVRHVIPPGTAISMSSVIMHANQDIFPEPDKFRPDRWLTENGARRKELEGYLISFSKGTRQCLGINVAYCELYTTVAVLVLRVFPHMELFETTVEDVKYHHDHFVPVPRPDSLGVRVLMK